ncbi:negative regulator of mitosis-like [Teratosphaeria destructans]|uniref:Negative regulator of mitosis-like n=1 Tax=Teratosphaeria destructans TaxID=418781 RepID=A0A9W7SL70_9PEZI|nr:negative regulator of mitosis-like [Teratosphaeria destructans]
MAKVESLGLHTPVALSYLIREGFLPQDPKRDLYQWETYVFDDGNGDVEEEVLATKDCVVWSQGRFIRNVYRFELDGEDVAHALLTRFASAGTSSVASGNTAGPVTDGYGRSSRPRQSLMPLPSQRPSQRLNSEERGEGQTARALVVFLKSKVHVHYLSGATQILDLPFEVERALPAPQGCIVQRKIAPLPLPPTPPLPAAPPNSFLSQLQPTQSSQRSPTLARSFRASQPARPSPLGGNDGQLRSLFEAAFGAPEDEAEKDVPSIWTFTKPLAGFGVVSSALQRPKPRLSGKQQHGFDLDFEPLDATEELIYVSHADEPAGRGQSQLTLIVTANSDMQTLTVWHAWYIEETSLRDLLKQREAHKAAKIRRRSSFLSANHATGATTPAHRPRDQARESLVAPGTHIPGEPAVSQGHTITRKKTRQEEEAAMASQMDPDYQPEALLQTRESRRISSLNADMRGSQSTATASFGAAGSRRNASFGGLNDRKSFGHRKSRGSTPGSVFSRSVGPDDDSMELDDNEDFHDHDAESVSGIIRHMRATYEATGIDSVLGSAGEGFSHEMIVRRIHSFSISGQVPSGTAVRNFKVVMLRDRDQVGKTEKQKLNLYVHDQIQKNLQCLTIVVRKRTLWPELITSPSVAVPIVVRRTMMADVVDITSLHDGTTQAVFLSGKGLSLSTEDSTPCPMASAESAYRVYSPYEDIPESVLDKEIGKNRILSHSGPVSFANPGARGCFDELDKNGIYHRRRMQLRPQDSLIGSLLDVCQAVIPPKEASIVHRLWCMCHASLAGSQNSPLTTASDHEWVSFVAAVLAYAVKLLDAKARATLNLSRLASSKQKATDLTIRQMQRQSKNGHVFMRSAWSWLGQESNAPSPKSAASPRTRAQPDRRKDHLLVISMALAEELVQSTATMSEASLDAAVSSTTKLMLALHVFREEQKLCTLNCARSRKRDLAPLIAQLGNLLGSQAWSFARGSYYALEGADEDQYNFVRSSSLRPPELPLMSEPIGVFQWFEHSLQEQSAEQYPSVDMIASWEAESHPSGPTGKALELTPRICALSSLLLDTAALTAPPAKIVESMAKHHLEGDLLETLPEAFAAPLKEAIVRCERQPPTTWSAHLLQMTKREDLELNIVDSMPVHAKAQSSSVTSPRDLQTISHALDQHVHPVKTRAAGRHAVSQLIFSEDRRLVEAVGLMHYSSTQVGECPKEPEWDDAYHFEQQRRIMHFMTLRMMALPAGDGMIHCDCVTPLLTEKYILSGFTTNVLMQPMGHNLTIDRQWLTEEKCGWAYFHAGVSAGMRISRGVKGIDTSWIAFNKPSELTNRHAGLLLALGLRGHLRSLAKWLSFKYLTLKHSMTSVGLLLGLSASYMGSMDTLITRMLSVHITRMLPAGAAELNVAPIVQSAGLMGIGLLYYNTQHRRMSEVMLSEIEYMEVEDPDSGPDPLRDESYRLAAGFALGLINLGKGRNLKGLHGMYLPERLLAMAVGPRPVRAVHVFDRATAGAIMAIALIYMKSGDRVVASKVDIPDTEAQFDHVRPDMLMLRAMTRHIIMWDHIKAKTAESQRSWIEANLPNCYKGRLEAMHSLPGKQPLRIADVPFYNIVTGLAWALSLRYAGSGDIAARDEILRVVETFYNISGDTYFYDAKLARSTVRRSIDVLVLCAATVMAGTGDLVTFRYLRRLHGRTDAETPYGSHLASHLAIGALFMAGGTQTFGTCDLAIAALIIAFYPLLPTEVADNRVHLQALRHFWVFAAEARCLVIEDIDTHRPVSMPISVSMRDGSVKWLTAPCLLPELDSVAAVQTTDLAYWRVTLDFAGNPHHLAAFKNRQTVYVRRCPASEAHGSPFCAALAALNHAQASRVASDVWQSVFKLAALSELDQADLELVLPPDVQSSVRTDERGTVVDSKLILRKSPNSYDPHALWNLRTLFAWAERARSVGDGRLRWLGSGAIEALRAAIEERQRNVGPA